MRAFRATIVLFARTSGAAAATLAIPLFGGIGLIAAILFAGNGLSASDVVRWTDTGIAARAGLWIGWIVLAAPPTRALLGAPTAAWMRSLPIARAPLVALHVAALFALQIPWIALFARGASALSGAAAGALGAAIAGTIVAARSMRWRSLLAIFPIAAALWRAPPVLAIAIAAPVAAIAAHDGVFRGKPIARAFMRLVGGPAPIAIAAALLVRVVRGERAALSRALFAAAAGGVLGALGATNNDRLDAGFPWILLPIATVPIVVGAGVVAGPIARAEALSAWLFKTSGAGHLGRAAGRLSAASSLGAFLGLIAGTSAAIAARPPARIAVLGAAALTAWGAALCVLATFVARRALRRGKREGGALVVGLVSVAVPALLVSGLLDALALGIAGISAIAAAFADRLDPGPDAAHAGGAS